VEKEDIHIKISSGLKISQIHKNFFSYLNVLTCSVLIHLHPFLGGFPEGLVLCYGLIYAYYPSQPSPFFFYSRVSFRGIERKKMGKLFYKLGF
jgi:hypothetical protein